MFGSRNFLLVKSAGSPAILSGKLFMWGLNASGQLGLGDTVSRSSPVQVGALTDWTYVATWNSVLCVKKDNTLWAWGSNNNGQLGQNNTTGRSSPVQVGALTNWKTPAIVNSNSVCVKTDGTIWSWGGNFNGVLGLGNVTYYSSPKQIGSSTSWVSASVGASSFTLAIDNGKLFAWGTNTSYGALGLGDKINRSSPVQVGALTNWATLATGYAHSLCTKTDGTLWAWGNNYDGRLGLGFSGPGTYRSSPVQVGSLTNWSKPTCGKTFSACVKTDGTLWSWGSNGTSGSLGLNDNIDRSSPVQVGALTNWATLGTSYFAVLCVKTDNTLWSWGSNNNGQLGDGTIINRSSPVQVGSLTSWANKPSSRNNAGCIQT